MSNRWLAETGGTRGAAYAARFDELAASGADLHGEARFVDELLAPGSRVVDAGCGTGRVAAELARRGHDVTGVDLDASMLAQARARHPELVWVEGDLLDVTASAVGAPVDCVLLAGNVVVYLTPGTEADVVERVAGWLCPGGLLVAGFATDRHVSREQYAAWCARAGLEPVTARSGWDDEGADDEGADGEGADGEGADEGGAYTVQVHRRPAAPGAPPGAA